jgi:hypothetical protein
MTDPEPLRPLWATPPDIDELPGGTAVPADEPTPPRRRWWSRWRWEDVPFVVVGVVIVAALVTCATLQILDDTDDTPHPDAGCYATGLGYAADPQAREIIGDHVLPIACDEPHSLETYLVGRFTGADADAAEAPLDSATALTTCADAIPEFLGGDIAEARAASYILVPGHSAWAAGQHWYRCTLAETSDGSGRPVERAGSLRDGLRDSRPLAITCADVGGHGDDIETIDYVRCDTPHSGEFVGIHHVDDIAARPADADLGSIAGKACPSLAAAHLDLSRDAYLARTDLMTVWALPSDRSWAAHDRGIRCYTAESHLRPVIRGTLRALGTAPLPHPLR